METVKFEELGLYPQLLRAIKEMGFEERPLPVILFFSGSHTCKQGSYLIRA